MMTDSTGGFTQLIEAFTIFKKYADPTCLTHCEHDIMMICGVLPEEVSQEDRERLDELGFFVGNEFGDEAFVSYRFGSA